MFTPEKSSDFVRRTLQVAVALTAICGAGALNAQANVAAPAVDFKAYTAPSFAMVTDQDGVSSSSSADNSDAQASLTTVDPLHLNAMQSGRRRYGRPRYRGGNTNPDGSNKWIFYGGAGFAQPLGNTWHYDTPSWGVQVGGGRQFSYHFAVPIEFDYDNFGLAGNTIKNQQNLYNLQIDTFCHANQNYCSTNQITDISGLDGNAHVWSFSLQPTYTIYGGGHDGVGAYVLAGVGFYHKVTNFTEPEVGCDPYYLYYYGICEEEEANQIIDHYTSNAPGFDAGIGFTYKVSHFSNTKLYAEVRYVITLNSQRQGITINSPDAATSDNPNDYPANSNRTTYLPIKFGVRF